MEKHYWDRNDYILEDQSINVTFKELLLMDNEEFETWVDKMRARVLEVWDEYGVPPLAGSNEFEMEEEFRKMSGTPGITLSRYKPKSGSTKPYVDELDGKENVIINDGCMGSCVNQFFPTMMRAKINYQTKVTEKGFNGYAVYDLFKDNRFRNRMQKGCRRHFRKDSFYKYSISILANSDMGLVPAATGKEWVQLFKRDFVKFGEYGFWLSRVEPSKEGETGSGYTQVDASKFLWLSKADIIELFTLGIIGPEHLTNLLGELPPAFIKPFGSNKKIKIYLDPYFQAMEQDLKEEEQYHIRFFKNSTRIFPLGFTAFKIGYIQVAVNFPPMVAKYLYEKYTDHIKDQPVINIYDPSAGWGGRIAGAMTVLDDRHIHYIGTDPNTDNFIDELGKTRYEYLAGFINNSLKHWGYEPHTFEVFQLGSEVIGKDKKFKKYKGKLDLVFTSPPYFSKEQYSEDETQSCIKFPQYDAWREGFLRPTLETAVSYLKKNRYLLWNVADVFYGKECMPIEQDSSEILKSLGMKFVGVEKMVLMNMPGANRIGEDGTPLCKNYIKVLGRFRKYEPVYVWKKE
jgi:hypothetical protein